MPKLSMATPSRTALALHSRPLLVFTLFVLSVQNAVSLLTPRTNSTPHLNPYFRYASFKFTGTVDDPNWGLAANVDWRGEDLAPVEDQGTCDSSWAIAPVSAVESLLSISDLGLKILSKQQILDCQGLNKSCGGGYPTDAFEYMASHGVARAKHYPWASLNARCEDDGSAKYKDVKISMFEEADFYGSFGLLLATQNQPVVVNVQSSSSVFQNYASGIMDSESCFTNVVDHSVVLVGYNLFAGFKPYWILRNSWGTAWGELGYMKLAMTGGLGICGIHSTPAYYPALPSSVVASSSHPCGTLNPCGEGKCSIDPLTGLNLCSNCPSSFIAVTNVDGSQTCAPIYVCLQNAFNPCGLGTCVNDLKGGYSCICPAGYTQVNYSDKAGYTCVEVSARSFNSSKALYYIVQTRDSCSVIALNYGLTLRQLKLQNSKVNCAKLVPGKTALNVTQASKWKGCAVKYTWNKEDLSCKSVASLVNISLPALQALNPGLDCNSVPQGTQICVKSGNPPVKTPACGNYTVPMAGDTCASIIKKFKLNIFSFLLFNPGINCNSLTRSSMLVPMVCIDSSDPYAKANAKCPGKVYYVRKSDTCLSIIKKYFNRSISLFKTKNFGFNCFVKRLKIGQQICF